MGFSVNPRKACRKPFLSPVDRSFLTELWPVTLDSIHSVLQEKTKKSSCICVRPKSSTLALQCSPSLGGLLPNFSTSQLLILLDFPLFSPRPESLLRSSTEVSTRLDLLTGSPLSLLLELSNSRT